MLSTRNGNIFGRLKLLTECSVVGESCEGTGKLVYLHFVPSRLMNPALTPRYFYTGKSCSQLSWYDVGISKATTLSRSPECFEILLGLNKRNSKLTN